MPAVAPPPPPAYELLPAAGRVNHGAGMLALDGAQLLVCWYSGASEAGRDVAIVCARSDRHGAWSAPRRVSRPGERDLGGARAAKSVGNVALARDRTGRLVMIQGEVQSRRVAGLETCRSWRCGRIAFRVSTDEGRTWSRPTRLDDRRGALPRSRPLAVPGGDLVPVYREGGGAGVLRVDLAALEPGAPPAAQPIDMPGSADLLQPSLVAMGGQVVAYLRDRRRRFVWASRLGPGASWSDPRPTNLPNPGSAVEAFGYAGRTALVYNPSRRDRRTLALAFSRDGLAFDAGCLLVPHGAAGDVAYPAVAETGDGVAVAVSIEGKRRIAVLRLARAFLDACAAAPLPGQAAANMSSKFRR